MLRIAAAGLVLAALAIPAQARAESWQWPVRGAVVTTFHTTPDRFARGQHRGIDIAAARGTPVRSACTGRVTFAGPAATAGRTVSVRCGALTASYLHLSSFRVRRGEPVAAGERLGATGTSGQPSAPAPHLHLGVRRAAHDYVDPLTLLAAPEAPPPPGTLAPPPRRTPKPRPRPLTRPSAPTPAHARPPLALLGAGLVVLALPGWGVRVARRRRLRAVAAAKPA